MFGVELRGGAIGIRRSPSARATSDRGRLPCEFAEPVRRTTMQVFDRRRLLQSFVDRGFQFHFIAASPTAVGSDDQFATGVVDAIDERGAGEPAEDHGMRRADPRAGQHRDRQLRNQRHVKRDAIAFFDAQLFKTFANLQTSA